MIEIYKYLQSLNEFKFDFSLERIKSVLSYLGNPQNFYRVIHITGSNGKGSVASFLSSIFYEAGIRVGLYTSPHLIDVRERIKIDNKLVSRKEFSETVLKLRELIEAKNIKLTYFEFLTVVAFMIFKKSKISVAIIEVGLGGRLDATNVNYKNKSLSIITSIDLEHTNYLGKTKRLILLEKEKIIGKGYAVCNIKNKGLKNILKRLHGDRILFPEDFYKIEKLIMTKNGLEILVKQKDNGLIKVKTSVTEPVQAENIITVLTALYSMKKRKLFDIPFEKILVGLEKTVIQARFTKHKRGYYLSVAHNPAAIKEMLKAARLKAGRRKIIFIYSSLKDKDINGIFRVLSRDKNIFVILTSIDNERAIDIDKLQKSIVKYDIKYRVEPDNFKALKMALNLKNNGIIVITGSFYLVNKYI